MRITMNEKESYLCSVKTQGNNSVKERIITEGYNSKYELRGEIGMRMTLTNDINFKESVKQSYEHDKKTERATIPQEFDQFKIIEPMPLIIDDDHMQFVTGNKAEMMKPKREYKEKRVRKDRKEVEPMLFELFAKNTRYQIKGLVELTAQPENYLKEILSDICYLNTKGPYRGFYELKPEYQSKVNK